MSTPDTEQAFLGFAYGPWINEPDHPSRMVFAVLDERCTRMGVREIRVARLRDQVGYADVVRADQWHPSPWSRPWWTDAESEWLASVFIGTRYTRAGAQWPRRKPMVNLPPLNDWERNPVLDRLPPGAGGDPGRLAPVNPDGQPHA